ncbi:MAG TPA: ABC transporter ATP-binding protein [Solirubrobacterales bacterium]|nr:ABC transporter ATP-binding protein [Solirubrobacterales bacterium]
MIGVRGLRYVLPDRREILAGIDFELPAGRFLAVLGENGAGKTTLLDLLMGFRRRTGATITVLGQDPETDPWESRTRIAYLSEKHDVPGDWEAGDYLDFHRRFYARFDPDKQWALSEALAVRRGARAGTLSAGEARRVQIVGALATRPELLIADEITALLDILGRRRFLRLLKERQERAGLTVVPGHWSPGSGRSFGLEPPGHGGGQVGAAVQNLGDRAEGELPSSAEHEHGVGVGLEPLRADSPGLVAPAQRSPLVRHALG